MQFKIVFLASYLPSCDSTIPNPAGRCAAYEIVLSDSTYLVRRVKRPFLLRFVLPSAPYGIRKSVPSHLKKNSLKKLR